MKCVMIHYKGKAKKELNKIIIELDTELDEDTGKKMIGKKVLYKTPSGREIYGVITKKHGQKYNKFIVRFKRDVCIEPGTSLEVIE